MNFAEFRLLLVQFLRRFILADAHFGIFYVVRFSRIVKFSEFCKVFIFEVAIFLFLTCTVPVVEIEIFPAILTKPKWVPQYDPQFTLSNSRIVVFQTYKHPLNSKLNKNFEKVYFHGQEHNINFPRQIFTICHKPRNSSQKLISQMLIRENDFLQRKKRNHNKRTTKIECISVHMTSRTPYECFTYVQCRLCVHWNISELFQSRSY